MFHCQPIEPQDVDAASFLMHEYNSISGDSIGPIRLDLTSCGGAMKTTAA
jgi:hypothetical protein